MVAITCQDCRALYEVELPGHPWDDNAKTLKRAISRRQVPAGVRCPQSPDHRIKIWRYPGKCPKCNFHLKKGDKELMWD